MSKAAQPPCIAHLVPRQIGSCIVFENLQDSPLFVPWEKLAYPWDNSFYELNRFNVPLPRKAPETEVERTHLASVLTELSWSAVRYWSGFHWVLKNGPAKDHKLPTLRRIMQDSKLEGDRLLALLDLCENLIGWPLHHEMPYFTSAHWWTLCVQDEWQRTVACAMADNRKQNKREARNYFSGLSKAFLNRGEPLPLNCIPNARHLELLLNLGIQRSASDHRFRAEHFKPYVNLLTKRAQRFDRPESTFTTIDDDGRLFIRGRGKSKTYLPLEDHWFTLIDAAYSRNELKSFYLHPQKFSPKNPRANWPSLETVVSLGL
jgi:hypothetical protein